MQFPREVGFFINLKIEGGVKMKRVIMLIQILLSLLLTSSSIYSGQFCKADCDGNCTVDLADLVAMKSEFLSPNCESCSPPFPAPVEKSGQTISYGTGDDGDLEKGVAWPK